MQQKNNICSTKKEFHNYMIVYRPATRGGNRAVTLTEIKKKHFESAKKFLVVEVVR